MAKWEFVMHQNVTAVRAETPSADPGGSSSPDASRRAADIGSLFDRLCFCLGEIGPEFVRDEHRVAELSQRLHEGRFHLAVLGQFKRGKSTLLNALLGEPLLPTSVVPLTAIPTFLRAGRHWEARVAHTSGQAGEQVTSDHPGDITALLEKYVTEAANPGNRLGVNHVEVTSPAEILDRGVVLIDTPGIGSTFRHNTEATLNFLPQCDAALFLVSADPPITEVEVDFLKEVRGKVVRLFFLLNKADYLSAEDRNEAVQFLRRVLKDQVGTGDEVSIFCVSARMGLKAKQSGDASLWARSGMAEVERHLIDFLASEKAATLRRALVKKIQGILADVLMRVRLMVRSLQMPLSELQDRMHRFEQGIADAQQQRVIAADILAGDKRRATVRLEEEAEGLRKRARLYFHGVVQEALATATEKTEEAAAQEALRIAIPAYFEREMGTISGRFTKYMCQVLQPHRERASELIQRVRQTAAALFDIPCRDDESLDVFELPDQPYWITHCWDTLVGLIPPEFFDKFLPAASRRARVRRRLMERVEKLVLHNVEDLRWTTRQSLERTFRNFASDIDDRLKETIAATHGAIQVAQLRRQEHAGAIAAEVQRLKAHTTGLSEIQSALSQADEELAARDVDGKLGGQ
jgi:GTP-binding protein EngB required for normal cell division